jgi:hypothetical protein
MELIRRNLMIRGGVLVHVAALCVLLVNCGSASAQDDPPDIAPPPIKLISKSERSQLKERPDIKDHTVLALQLMDTRLRSAEKYRTNENYTLMFAELGGFQGLMDNTLDFLLKSPNGEGKRLNGLKRFEIGLRGYIPRIEGIRRELPSNFEPYVKSLIKYVSDVREKAIEPFFSNSVIGDTL